MDILVKKNLGKRMFLTRDPISQNFLIKLLENTQELTLVILSVNF
jgi:hypothetical protein